MKSGAEMGGCSSIDTTTRGCTDEEKQCSSLIIGDLIALEELTSEIIIEKT